MKTFEIFLIVLFSLICNLNGTSSFFIRKKDQQDHLSEDEELQEVCPQGFTKFRKHCFYISKEKGYRRDAKKTCQKMGGYQVWISDRKKENIVVKYLRANYYHGNIPRHHYYVWLPDVKGGGLTFNWTDSGQNAKVFMNRHGYYGTRFSGSNRPDVFITVFGDVSHCTSDCKPLQAFCETDMVAKNNTNPKPAVDIKNVKQIKPRKSKPQRIKNITEQSKPRKSKPQSRKKNLKQIYHRPLNKSKAKPTEKKMVASYPACPQGFTKFQKHCFYISKETGSRRDAKKTCEKVGGYQVWISDRKNEKIVVKYLRASYYYGNIPHYRFYVWLADVKRRGLTFKWTDSGQNAKVFMHRHGYYGSRFSAPNRPKVFINVFGSVYHCTSDCKPLQAFCEADMVAKNNAKANATNRNRKRKETDTRKWKQKRHSPDSKEPWYEAEDNADDYYENFL